MTSVGFLRFAVESPQVFLAVATPVDLVTACGIECDADYEVDWGDGTFIPYVAGRNDVVPTGTITVRGVGTVTWFKFHTNTFNAIDVQESSSVTSLNSSFQDLFSMTSFDINDTSNVEDFSFAWSYCLGLASFPLIDCSKAVGVGKFQSVWRRCVSIISFPLIITTGVTHFEASFYQMEGLTSFPLIDTSSAVTVSYAWANCASLILFPLIDTSNVQDFSGFLSKCSSLTSVPALDLSSCTNFSRACNKCTALVSIAATGMTSMTTDINYAFENCGLLIAITGVWDTSGIQDWRWSFAYCTSLLSAAISSFSFANALRTDVAFLSCQSLTYVGDVNCSLATSVSQMYNGCILLSCVSSIDLTSATNRTNIFGSTNSLVAPNSSEKAQLESGALVTYTNPGLCP